MSNLKESWQDFIIERKNNVAHVREPILESWQRCLDDGIDPLKKSVKRILSSKEFERVLELHQPFIHLSTPYMNNLYAFVKDSGFVISLVDNNGVILKIIGDQGVKEKLYRGSFVEGADWSESSAGTNAIGTALYEATPMQVYSYEHFCRFAQVATCSCAPIRDVNNHVIGAINLTGYDNRVTSHTLGMAVASAYAIQNALIMDKAQESIKLADTYKTIVFDSINQGVLATDSNGIINHLNSTARTMLGISPDVACSNKSIFSLIPTSNDSLAGLIRNLRFVADEEITVNTRKGAFKYNVTSHCIKNVEGFCGNDGIVLIMDELKRVRKMIRKMSGAMASISFDNLIGGNAKYQKTIHIAKKAAQSDSTVLLLGESGTGKDVIAQAIHNHSDRHQGPFVAINCGAIPRELIGSELFGYVEGAFTGARKGGNVGKFELADGGTIFLDEIGDMPLEMQTHLLRVLEEKKLTRIGGQDVIPIDVRIIVATNRDLSEEVKQNRFRQDLFYRLNVITIHLVPLRDRKDDIPDLIEFFYNQLIGTMNRTRYAIPKAYIDILSNYDFPGNIRELQNIIERSINLSSDGQLDPAYLPEEVFPIRPNGTPDSPTFSMSFEEFEEKKLMTLINSHDGNLSKVAKDLGIARSTLYRKLDKYGVSKKFVK